MSGIRDKVREKVADVVWPNWRNLVNYHQIKVFEDVDKILSELAEGLEAVEKGYNAKVDMKAALPKCRFIEVNLDNIYRKVPWEVKTDCPLLKAGFKYKVVED